MLEDLRAYRFDAEIHLSMSTQFKFIGNSKQLVYGSQKDKININDESIIYFQSVCW